jgi:hypothetical protein
MRNVDWDDLRFFQTVSECNPICLAMKFLNVNRPTLLSHFRDMDGVVLSRRGA